MTRILYPGKVEPVLTTAQFPETVTESRWHQPWSDPVRIKPGLNAALQQFQPYDETQRFPETVTEDRWHQDWSRPSVLSKPFVAWQQFIAQSESAQFPESVTEDRWHQPWSEPSVKAKIGLNAALQQFLAQSESAQFPETVTESRWHQPWSEPSVKAKIGLNAALQQFLAQSESAQFPESVSIDRWNQQWTNPLRFPPRSPDFPYQFYGYPPVTAAAPVGFYYPWTDPVRIPPRLNAALNEDYWASESAQFPESVTEDRWHQPWSLPVRVLPRDAYFEFLAWPPTPVFSVPAINYLALSEPVRIKLGLNAALQQFLSYSESAQFPESVTEDRWHQDWSLPVRTALRDAYFEFLAWPPTPVFAASIINYPAWSEPVRSLLRTAYFEFLLQSESAQFPETVTEDRWHQDWSLPVRTPQRPAYFEFTAWPPTPVFSVPSFGYFNAFSDPVRQKLGLNAGLQQFLSYSESAQFPESVTEDRWHQDWSLPVRILPRDAYFEFTAWPPTPVFAVPPINYPPLSEPVRIKLGLNAALQQFLAQSESAQFPESVTEDRWHQDWSLPVRTIPRAAHFNDFWFGTQSPIIPSFGYYNWFNDPVRTPLRTTQFQDFAFGTQSPIIPAFGYYNWLSEPVRIPARVLGPQDYFSQPSPVSGAPTFGYYNWLSEPVRQKLGLLAALQQFAAQSESAQFPESVTEDRWHQDWSLPVRRIPQLDTYPFETREITPIIPSFGYFNALATPTLRVSQLDTNTFYFWSTLTPPQVNPTASLNVTEQGDLFNGLMMLYSKTTAIVSIITAPPPPTNPVGIISSD